ncbi:extracellular solute-binding protein [Cohnella sp. CFH 77786]|uniref:extracellular solute-binding protein n=1 Tax=Cohnella sp. CFH 77786 TaxID=2662265 RepID=UPI001C60F4DE|nr:extracellular solute-binding protein [Cohnella sp. CFH 77786]MBW5447590.1 extracellular solute-binding protein [Cohnella sp. CFH 77786]
MLKPSMRKASAAVLSMTLGVALLAGCTGKGGEAQPSAESKPAASASASAETKADPLGKQPELTVVTRGVSLDPNQKYPDGQSLDDNAYTRMLKDKFNIQIENAFSAAGGEDYQKKVDLAIASAKIPDYMTNLTYTEYKAIVKAGLAMDISDVWEQYASPKTKEVYNSNKALFDSLVKKDGKMYAIPSSNPLPDFLSVMWIRQDWLDKLGLKAPTNLDELAAVAKAFVERDPDGNNKADTVGIVGPSVNGKLYQDMANTNFSLHFDPIFAAFNAFPGIWVKDGEGKAVYGSIQPETKAALQKLADMYKQGLISPGMIMSKTEELIANNKAGLFFGTWWNPFADIGNSWKNDKNANWQPYLLPSGSDGIYLAKGGNAAQTFTVISKDAKNPEAVIKMLNIFKEGLKNYVDEKDQTVLGDGAFPMYQTFSIADGPAMVMQELNNYYAGKKTADEIHAYFNNYDAYQNQAFDKIIASKTKPYDKMNISGWDFSGDKANEFGWVWSFGVGLKPYVDGKFKWVNSLTYERTKTMDKRWANLTKLELETFSKIIIGREPISAFDTFVSKWKDEGGNQITEEIQSTLNQ